MIDGLSELGQFINFEGEGGDQRVYFANDALEQTQSFKPEVGFWSFYLIASEAHPDPMVASFNKVYQWVGFEVQPAPVPGDLTIAAFFGG